MVQIGFTKPNNDVIQGDSPFVEFLMIKTVANCYPGRLVTRDTDDSHIKVNPVAATASPVGWLGYALAFSSHKPTNRDTIYAVNASAPVHKGKGFRVRASLASGENVVKGAPLVAAANGEVAAAAAITITASGAANITTGQGVNGSYGAAGPIVAIADESVDASGGAAAIWVLSEI